MKFLIVAPFIRFRKEGYLSRHVVIAEEIANSGNEVFVITSKFSHSRKKNRNFRNYSENGVSYFLISELGYNSNRTFKRFLSHFILSINIFIFLLKFKFLNRHKFDIIISTLPLGFLSILLSIFARLNKILLLTIAMEFTWGVKRSK